MGKESDSSIKSQLVMEICSLSTLSFSCVHKHPNKSHFLDWYRLLGVDQDADIDVIRKKYHRLALQLHPDKNKHPKAEIAFKLVLEAYSCLSDNVSRRAFDLERQKNFCNGCKRIPFVRCNSYARKHQQWDPVKCSRSSKILQGLKDIKERFREEAKVMQNCLMANANLRNKSPLFNPKPSDQFMYKSNNCCRSRRESPIFDPTDYLFDGYPHIRDRIYKKPEDIWTSQRQNPSSFDRETTIPDSPIFENRSVRRIFKAKSACVSS